MTIRDGNYDVIIVGGGISGCSSALHLADDHDVLLLEKGQIAGDASGKASGVITFSAQRSTLPEFVDYSLSFFRTYDGTEHFEFTERNAVELIPPEMERQARERASAAADHGFPLEFLDVERLEADYPGVFDLDGFIGGIEYRDTGFVDPYTCTTSYKSDAEANGAEFRTGVDVTKIRSSDGSVDGIETDSGERIDADAVVCAAGWGTRKLLSEIVEVPVRPFRYQAVDLQPDRELGEAYPIGMDPVTGFYWRPQHDGTLHVGGGEYVVSNPGGVRNSVKESFRREIATQVPTLLKGFDSSEITSEDTCPTGDAATPDSLPIIDTPTDGPNGLVVVTGMHGYGIMSSPSAGKAVRALLTDEPSPFPLESYALGRFESNADDFALVSLAEKREMFE